MNAKKRGPTRDLVADAIASDRGGQSLLDAKGQLPRDLAIEWRSVAKVRRYPDNPRDNAAAVADVRASLEAFGWQQPLVVDASGEIVVGDTRYLAALDMGQTHVPVYVARQLSPEMAAAYRLADNKVGERAAWDFPKLTFNLQRLRDLGVDLLLTGFRAEEIAAHLDPLPEPKFKEYDETAGDGVKRVKCPECGAEFAP